MGGLTLAERQPKSCAVVAILVVCLIAAMFVPVMPNLAEPAEEIDFVMDVYGETADAVAGRSVAFIDIDDDGAGDLIVGAPGDSTAGMSAGKVMIYLGSAIKTDPDVEITGAPGERFGFAVARAGDVNADGIDDLIVGAQSNDDEGLDAGAAYIIFGTDDAGSLPATSSAADVVLIGDVERAQLGYSVSTAGDVNSDGYDDVLIGAPSAGAGQVHLLYGGASMDAVPDKTFSGSTNGDQYGFSVAGGLNLDGTAQPDIAVGVPGSSSAKGAVQVILNPDKATPKFVTLSLSSAVVGDKFGTSLAILDYNDDVYGDVAVGAPYRGGTGEVLLYYGSALAGKFDRTVDVTLSEGAAGDMFGLSLASGDPRTDGITDLVVGAPGNDAAGIDAGCAYVFYGNTTADAEPDLVASGAEAESRFGWSVASGMNVSADYNDDLAADFAVGAPYCGASSEGAAYLFLGERIVLPSNPSVYGYVLDDVTGAGLANALVTMESTAYSRTTRTTTNGSYGLTSVISLPPGTYWINASFDDYFTGAGQHALTYDTRTNVSFDMVRLPVVSGAILDGNTSGPDPLEGALVDVRDDADALLDSLTTDATGVYSFVLEYTGAITVTASKDYYFDGDLELTVVGNDDLVDKDITLDHYPILMFSAEDTDANPIEGVDIEVSIDSVLLVTGETDEYGEATLMVPGTGSAVVSYSRVGFVPGSETLDISANEEYPIPVVMDRQPSIDGTVKDALFETPINGAAVQLYDTGTTDLVDSVSTDSYGYYSFPVVEEGTYDMRVTATGYMCTYRLSVLVEADDVATEDFWLVADSVPPTSEITDPSPGTVFTSAEFTLCADAVDPNCNEILYVTLYYSHEGKPYKTWSSDMEAPYEFEFNASEAYGDGVYEFYTRATDCARNTEVMPTANDTWIIMNSGLPVSELDPLDPYQSTDTFTVTASASDPFGVQYVELWYSYEGSAFELYGSDDAAPYSWEFTASDGDGTYGFYSILVNGLDQSELVPEDADTTTMVDTTSPGIVISSPVEDEVIAEGTIELQADASDGGSGLDYVSYQVDSGDEIVVEVTDGLAVYALSVDIDLEDGEHTIVVTATDMLGWQSSDQVTFLVDTSAPTLTILHPVDGSAVNTPDVEVSWSVEDAVAGVVLTEVRVGGGSWEVVIGTSVLLEDLDDDVYTVDVRVTDGADNQVTASTTFEVDTIDPTVYITSPTDGSLLTTSTVIVKWEQSDIGAGLAKVEIRLDGGDWELTSTNISTFESVQEGSHTVDVMATDEAGNTDMDSVTFEVDGTMPVISIASPIEGELLAVSSVTAEWTVTDGGTGVSTVEYKLDAAAWVATTETGSYLWSGLSEGSHMFSIRAEDNAGNIATESVEFSVDTVDPTVEITSPADGATVSSSDVTVEYTVDGTGSDVTTVERRVDGGSWESAGMTSTVVESLDDGLHTVDIRATDEAGHQATASVEFTVEVGAPVVTITSPAEGTVFDTDTVTVTWTVSKEGTTVEIKLDDGAWAPAGDGSETFVGLDEGAHTVTVRSTDDAENVGEDSVSFTVDTVPPTVSIVVPADDSLLSSSSVTVSWTSTDAATTELSTDGGLWVIVTGTSTVMTLADGDHTVSIRVTDGAGHTGSDSVSFTVDTTAPTVDITAPADGSTTSSSTVMVEFDVDDGSGSGIAAVEVSIDAGAWQTADSNTAHTFVGLSAGEHTVEVRARDQAGNAATAFVSFTVLEDTTAPTVSITSPENGTSIGSSSVTVEWTASDGAGSGIASIAVKLDSGAWMTATGGSWVFADLDEGTHTVWVRVTDGAGNEATDQVSFMIDTIDPSLTITSPDNEWETDSTSVTVMWTCTDSGCGVDRIEVSIDGGSYVLVGTAAEHLFEGLDVGDHTVTVRAYDKAGNMVSASVSFTVTEEGGISTMLIVGIVLAVIVVAALAAVLMRRKKATPPPST